MEIKGEPWFVGKDVTNILRYTNSSKAIKDHVDDEDKLNNESLLSLGQRGGWLINESGLYSLIFASKLPKAKEFKHWVTSEVLPSIRKHGAYIDTETIKKNLLTPEFIIGLATELKNEKEARIAAEEQVEIANEQIEVMQPKVNYYDELCDIDGLSSIRDTAKLLNMSQKEFVNFLLSTGLVYRDSYDNIRPYSSSNKGYFTLRERTRADGKWKGLQFFITQKGREKLCTLRGNSKIIPFAI